MTEGCISSSTVPHMGYPFQEFNPAQSLMVPWRDQDVNIVCAFRTSAGKTVCAELVIDDAVRRGRKAVYTSPLKALSQEKYDDWTNPKHAFSKFRISILTGDYMMTQERVEELRAADVIIMTSEMLSSRCRRMDSERNDWLLSVGAVCVDEAHLIGVEDRGDALECGLMDFTRLNPSARLVFLSATVANSADVSEWAGLLNGKKTVHLRSEYRPVPLRTHYEPYDDSNGYREAEASKLGTAVEIAERNKDDHFLFFVHSKKNGHELLSRLQSHGFTAAFHNADLLKSERTDIEQAFRDGSLPNVVATSTLAWGVNLPARRVVVVGVQRGMQYVHAMDILQMVGRSGRPGYDKEGDAYILVPEKRMAVEIGRLGQEPSVESRMLDVDVLAFHVVSGIERGQIADDRGISEWYSRSFAFFQGRDLTGRTVDELVSALSKCGAIRKAETGFYEALSIGKVAAWFYYSPFDIADWVSNLGRVASDGRDPDDLDLAWAFSHTRSRLKGAWLPGDLRNEADSLIGSYGDRGLEFDERSTLLVSGLLKHLAGKDVPSLQRSAVWEVSSDAERMTTAVKTASEMLGTVSVRPSFWKTLSVRLRHGVSREAAVFCEVDGVGGKRARLLHEAGFKSFADVATREHEVRKVLGPRIAERVIEHARRRVSS